MSERDVRAYIATFDEKQQERMSALYDFILACCPQAQVKISWQMPTFQYYGNLVHFAQQKHHLGFYPGEHGVSMFVDQIEKLHLKYSKGAIQIPDDMEIPFDLIKEIIVYRIKENEDLKEKKTR